MPFVKLDTGILRSTLWFERDARELFITALLMAEPYESQESIPALKVDAIESTGFVVPPGWYGFVPAAGIGIIRQAGMDRDAGMKALAELGSPDTESRSSDFEGRRLVRVDGGYIVLNYMKYRDRDNTVRERMRRYRQRQKELHSNSVSLPRNVTAIVTNAEVEAEAEADKSNSDDTRAQVDLESAVLQIAALYPKVRDPHHISQEVQHAIAEAVARDGRDLVWAGTKNMAEAVSRWPRSELKFIPAAGRFFRESQYRTEPAEWERGSDGKRANKTIERAQRNRGAIIDALRDMPSSADGNLPSKRKG